MDGLASPSCNYCAAISHECGLLLVVIDTQLDEEGSVLDVNDAIGLTDDVGHVLSLDGADMGVLGTKDELIANGCAGKRGSPAFVPWGDSRVLKVMPPASAAGEVYTPDGVNLRRYDVRSSEPKTDFKGYDLAVWVHSDHWAAELRVPWAELQISAKSGQVLRVNIVRNVVGGEQETSSWYPELTGGSHAGCCPPVTRRGL